MRVHVCGWAVGTKPLALRKLRCREVQVFDGLLDEYEIVRLSGEMAERASAVEGFVPEALAAAAACWQEGASQSVVTEVFVDGVAVAALLAFVEDR